MPCWLHALRGWLHKSRCWLHALRGWLHKLRCWLHALRGWLHELRCWLHALRGWLHELHCWLHKVGFFSAILVHCFGPTSHQVADMLHKVGGKLTDLAQKMMPTLRKIGMPTLLKNEAPTLCGRGHASIPSPLSSQVMKKADDLRRHTLCVAILRRRTPGKMMTCDGRGWGTGRGGTAALTGV